MEEILVLPPCDSTSGYLNVWKIQKHQFEKISAPLCSLQHYLRSSQGIETGECPSIDEWIKKMHLYITEYYSAMKKNNIVPFATIWMDLEGIMLNEISPKGKNEYHMISCT